MRLRFRGARRAGYVATPRPLVEPVSTADGPYLASFAFYRRVGLLGGVAAVAFAVVGLRAWSLQVLHTREYVRAAVAEQTRVVDLPAARGLIVDDRERPLATVGAQVVVVADPPALGRGSGNAWRPTRTGGALLAQLGRLAHVSAPTLVDRIRSSLVQSPFGPAVILPAVPRALGFYLDERARSFPGLHVVDLPTRAYPQGALGSEFLGLLGQISPAELKEKAYTYAKAGETIGQSGVEATYDRYLNGGFSTARVHVNALGRITSPLEPTRAGPRPDGLELTIDARIQRAAQAAVEHGIALAHRAGYPDADGGAAIVMNVHTGALEALVSEPSFNQVAAVRDPSYLERLIDGKEPGLPLLDRATQGLYPPGSTFKPIVAEAALSAGIVSPTTELACTGSLQVGNLVFHNVEPAIDAMMNLPQALEISCDTWFYQLGEQFYGRQQHGSYDIQRWARALGLGSPTGIDVPGEAAGVVPTPSWLATSFPNSVQGIWYEGTSVNLSIGQGYLEVTPLQLAVAYAALANGGTVVRPHLGEAVLTASGPKPLAFPARRHIELPGLAAVREGLFEATHGSTGTSTATFGSFRVPVDGKTGTAQVPDGSDDAWFASWAPANDPQYVVVVLIEHGGFGADAAAPAARDIYSALFPTRR